jgi:hypothetical protein
MLTRPALGLRSQGYPVETAGEVVTANHRRAPLDVGIASIATAVPKNRMSQQEVTERARRIFPRLAARGALYFNTGIGLGKKGPLRSASMPSTS